MRHCARFSRQLTLVVMSLGLVLGCARRHDERATADSVLPRAAEQAENTPAAALMAARAGSGGEDGGGVGTHAAEATNAGAAGGAGAALGALDITLVAADGSPLPQTEERPNADSAAFKQHLGLLLEAIARDEPPRALAAFFPLVAYQQVKAIADPARDWRVRLVAAFERNIHEYHRALPPNVRSLRLLGVDVPESKIRWMKPGSEGNRVGYFRVLRAHLRAQDEHGKEHAFELTSLISWRGEWYVVHLHGFK